MSAVGRIAPSMSASQAVVVSFVSYCVWRAIRPFVVASPLSQIPGPRRKSWWKGNFAEVFNRFTGWDYQCALIKDYGGVARLQMLFGDEQLYICDPLALHHIVVKDQDIFEETEMFLTSNELIFGKSLISTLGEEHKRQRRLLNPVFSAPNMRDLVPVFYPIANQLRDILIGEVKKGVQLIELSRWMSRAALEYIGQGGLGATFDALDVNRNNNYTDSMKSLAPLSAKLIFYRQFLPYLVRIGSATFRRTIVNFAPFDAPRRLARIKDDINNCAADILRRKREDLADGHGEGYGMGKDIVTSLLRSRSGKDEEGQVSDAELLSHMSTFIFTGHESTSTALCRILHLLGNHPDVQERLRNEILDVERNDERPDYETLMNLPYLDAVCRETLRLYPPVSQLSRTTRRDTILPLRWPITSSDGSHIITEIPIRRNTNIIISVLGANRCERIWGKDADEWKPQRWLEPLPESVAEAKLPGIYSSQMTFLGGARACIGYKFAETEMKLVLFTLLSKLRFEPGPEIFWTTNFVSTPTVQGSGDSLTQMMPMKVSIIDV